MAVKMFDLTVFNMDAKNGAAWDSLGRLNMRCFLSICNNGQCTNAINDLKTFLNNTRANVDLNDSGIYLLDAIQKTLFFYVERKISAEMASIMGPEVVA